MRSVVHKLCLLFALLACFAPLRLGASFRLPEGFDFDQRLIGVEGMTGDGVSKWLRNQEYFAYDYRGRRVWAEEAHQYNDNAFNYGTEVADTKTTSVFSGGTAIREYAQSISGNYPGNAPPVAGNWTPANTTLAPSVELIRGSDLGGGIGGILYSLHNDNPSYYHYDGRGDVVAQTTSNSGNLSYQAAYTAFGEHNPNPPASARLVHFTGMPTTMAVQGFGAQEWTASGAQTDRFRKNTKEESDSGLINEGQRYFDPEAGRFLTEDPLGLADGSNPFNYTHQNPAGHYDPEGLAVTPRGEFTDGDAPVYPGDGDNGPLLSPRGAAVVGALGSGIEMVLGAVTTETGFGGVAAVHGADNFGANLSQIITGKPATSFTERTITAATGSRKAGAIGNAAIGLFAPVAAGLPSAAAKVIDEMEPAIQLTNDAKAATVDIAPSAPATNAPAGASAKVSAGQVDVVGGQNQPIVQEQMAQQQQANPLGAESGIAKAAPVWPKTAAEMDEFLKVPGRSVPDTAMTPGRNKWIWEPNSNTKITLEGHPYDAGAPAYHTDPHWHLDTPGADHVRYLPGEPIPGN